MNAEKVVEIMGRELAAIGQYYRNDWSDFDGRTLRSQLADLASRLSAGLGRYCVLFLGTSKVT